MYPWQYKVGNLIMELHEKIEKIASNKDLADFIEALQADFAANPNEWENNNLESFLEAMSAWTRSMENAYRNTGREFPNQPNWAMIADILYTAKIYE